MDLSYFRCFLPFSFDFSLSFCLLIVCVNTHTHTHPHTKVMVLRKEEMVLTFIPKPTMIDFGKNASTNTEKGNSKNT